MPQNADGLIRTGLLRLRDEDKNKLKIFNFLSLH